MADFNVVQPKHHDVYPFISTAGKLANVSSGKSVLVVGAGSGIGKAIAIAFAETGASNVVISSRRQANLDAVKSDIVAKSPKANVLAIAADAAKPVDIDKLFENIKAAGITLDVLVNSQGLRLSRKSIYDSDPDDWWTEIEVMLRSPYLTTRAFLHAIPKPVTRPEIPDRSIINITSIAGHALLPLGSSYSIPKIGLDRLTEFSAAEATHWGVQSIAIHPGGVPDTGITSTAPAFMHPYYTETAELAANATVYCTTPAAAYLNGRYVDVRWDLEELEKHSERIVEEDLLKASILGDARQKPPPAMMKVFETQA